MVIWVLISCAFACDLPQLPPVLDFFTPAFTSEGYLSGSGRFASSSQIYTLQISQDSWFRVSAEPKRHAVELIVTQSSSQKYYSSAKALGRAAISGKLLAGTYELSVLIEESSQATANIFDCKFPNMYFNIAVTPYILLPSYKSKNFAQTFPDLKELDDAITMMYPFSTTFDSTSIPVKDLKKDFLMKYQFTVPEVSEEMKLFGFTGLWELTFALRNL